MAIRNIELATAVIVTIRNSKVIFCKQKTTLATLILPSTKIDLFFKKHAPALSLIC